MCLEGSLERFMTFFGDIRRSLPVRGHGCDLDGSYLPAVDGCAGVDTFQDFVVCFVGHIGCVLDPVDWTIWMYATSASCRRWRYTSLVDAVLGSARRHPYNIGLL